MKRPDNKNDLIKYLMDRLDVSQQCIQEAENWVTNERAKRLQLKEELQKKNDDLRQVVEGEKKSLQDKVHEELKKTLDVAVQGKVKAEEELKSKVNECRERDMMCQELDYETLRMRQELRDMREKQKQIPQLEEQNKSLTDENKNLKEENTKLNQEIEECFAVIK